MIKLYYIPGISREDTPVFDTDLHQSAFFDNIDSTDKLIISDGFYPPHYQNKITLEMQVVNYGGFPLRWNYLELTFSNKKFYYFIDKIEYVNEDLVDFYITMDTIQTYMFNIQFIQSHVTRRSIRRWIYDIESQSNLINRDYLRESFSDGKFVLKEKKYYTYNKDFSSNASDTSIISGYMYARIPSDGAAIESHCLLPDGNNFAYSYTSNRLAFVPEILGSLEFYIHWSGAQNQIEAKDALNSFIKNHTDTIFVAYLPFDNVNLGGMVVNQVFNVDESAAFSNDSGAIKYNDGRDILTYVLYDEYETGFVRPTFSGNNLPAFNVLYNPVLLDETYYKVTFGEKTTRSQFPLHLSLSPKLTMNYYGDIFTSKRAYYITTEKGLVSPDITILEPNTKRIIGDTYDTLAIANDLVTADVNADAFKQYYTYNKASTFMGAASAALALAMLFI